MHKNVNRYLAYLEETFIPDLKTSGREFTAADLEKLASLIKTKKRDEDFEWFLTETLIPDLYESGDEYTAEDFEDGLAWLASVTG